MNPWLLLVVTVCYGGTGIQFFMNGMPAWGVFWTCYAVANLAYLMAMNG